MARFAREWRTRLLGQDPCRTRVFLGGALGLCIATIGFAGVGTVLLSRWPLLYAHLAIETAGLLLIFGTIGTAIANAYTNGGVLTNVLVTFAPLIGLFAYLVFQDGILVPLTIDVLLSLGTGATAVGLGSYLVGRVLFFQRSTDHEPVIDDF